MKNKITFGLFILLARTMLAQTPSPALVGYWQNWQDANSPYIQLDQLNSCYNIIDVAFAVPHNGTAAQMEFIPDQVSAATLISQIQTVKGQGKKLIISIGGATAPVTLNNTADRDTFINTVSAIINTYDFDGIDLDLEGSSLSVSGGTIANPTDQSIINLIYAVKKIMQNYYAQHNKRLLLTMAPETAFVQGGMSAYSGIWGAYLPVIEALKDSIEILHVQLYNSGSMYGIDGNVYAQGTADFIIAMSEAVIQGFTTAGGNFSGLSASKVAIGLPACTGAAGGGYTNPSVVKSAVDYLRGTGTRPGSYTLVNTVGYPQFRGMMTWSVNWDAVSTCGAVYEYANNFQTIFGACGTTAVSSANGAADLFEVYPNPTSGTVNLELGIQNGRQNIGCEIRITNILGGEMFKSEIRNPKSQIDISSLQSGIYFLCAEINGEKIVRKIIKE